MQRGDCKVASVEEMRLWRSSRTVYGPEGFEPGQYHLKYHPSVFVVEVKCFVLYGERGRNRTYNLLIKRQCTGVV